MTVVTMIRRAQQSAPVDIIGLANDLGVNVNEAWLADDVSGELVRIDENKYEINVNAAHHLTRKRFTIAHELGHFLYHKDLIGDGLDDDRAYRSTSAGRYHNTRIGPVQETQANQFAANTLMPHTLINSLRAEGLSRSQMAKRLQVSEHALAIRLGEPYP